MLTELTIEQFRGLSRLHAPRLARVNLFVGRNNAGKTSLLEAVEFLGGGGGPAVLARALFRRGETTVAVHRDERYSPIDETADFRHVFHRHRLDVGSALKVSGRNGQPTHVECRVEPYRSGDRDGITLPMGESDLTQGPSSIEAPVELRFTSSNPDRDIGLTIGSNGIPTQDGPRQPAYRRRDLASATTSKVVFVGTGGMEPRLLRAAWNAAVLTPQEDLVYTALRILHPNIERVAPVDDEFASRSTMNFWIKLTDDSARLPVGSLGEGSRRLLGAALALAQASGGMLLIDEIDTGLHHSALRALWTLVVEGARRLDVQIFATTHSADCLKALGDYISLAANPVDDVLVHRIDPGRSELVTYSPSEIEVAVRHDTEMRG